jgi:hypothetical protein
MKNILIYLLTLFCASTYAQVPTSFNYQAVVRNGAGTPIINANVAFQFSILPANNPAATGLYVEAQNATTDGTGLVSLKIGQGRVIIGSNLNAINWSLATGSKFMKVEIDPLGGTNYLLSSISELISVPYAIVSQKSIEDKDAQTLTLSGQNLTISGSNSSVTLPNTAATQNLTLNGQNLGITGGNSVTLPTPPTPSLTLNGQNLGITGGNTVTLPNTTAATQNLTLNGQNLGITGGNVVTLPTAQTPNLTLNGLNLGIAGGNVVALPNAIQNLTLNGSTLGISGGNSVTLPSGGGNYTAGNGIDISLNTITNTQPTQWTSETANSISYMYGRVGIGRAADSYHSLMVNGTVKVQNNSWPNESAWYSTNFMEIDYKNRQKVVASASDDSLGNMGTYGLYGSSCRFTRLSNYPNNPYIGLDNATSVSNVPKIGILIDQAGKGAVQINENGFRKAGFYYDTNTGWTAYASVKSFREQHPTQPDKEIWYACIEGREAAIYVRGTAKLENGRATITFPEDFNLMALAEGMTAMTTPNSMNSKGLAVFNKTTTGFEVGELSGGTGNYSFDWEVKAVRKGYENFKIVRDKMKGDAVDEPKKRDEKRQ